MDSALLSSRYGQSAIRTVDLEIGALQRLRASMDDPDFCAAFDRAVEAMVAVEGRVIVCGMGKSGLVGSKIAATLRSTGTPASFLHPSEASHGDLGLIAANDVVLAISWSGETRELADVLHYCQRRGITLIVATAGAGSTACRAATFCLKLPQVDEACPNALAPTSSTTVQMVLGDMLAIALMQARGFSSSDFHGFHPGGKLGTMLMPISRLMGADDAVPKVNCDAPLSVATIEMSRKRYGATAVVDDQGLLVGVFTDGDLRRCIGIHDLSDPINLHMSPNPITVEPDTPCNAALQLMNENAVSVIFVVEGRRLVGVVHMHDLVRACVG